MTSFLAILQARQSGGPDRCRQRTDSHSRSIRPQTARQRPASGKTKLRICTGCQLLNAEIYTQVQIVASACGVGTASRFAVQTLVATHTQLDLPPAIAAAADLQPVAAAADVQQQVRCLL